jgi:hypothetical protein
MLGSAAEVEGRRLEGGRGARARKGKVTSRTRIGEDLDAFLSANAPGDVAGVLSALAKASLPLVHLIRRGRLAGALDAAVGPAHDGFGRAEGALIRRRGLAQKTASFALSGSESPPERSKIPKIYMQTPCFPRNREIFSA